MVRPSKPSLEQQKRSCAKARLQLLCLAAVGGLLMVPLSLAVIPVFLFEDDKWDVFGDHFELWASLGIIGGALVGSGLSGAAHCRKKYEQLENAEFLRRDAVVEQQGAGD